MALQPLEEVCDVAAGKVLHTEERCHPEAVTEEALAENLSLEKKDLVCGNEPGSRCVSGPAFCGAGNWSSAQVLQLGFDVWDLDEAPQSCIAAHRKSSTQLS